MTHTSLSHRLMHLGLAAVVMAVAATPVSAQEGATLEVVAHFDNAALNGTIPAAPLMQASDGKFYGTTSAGGKFGRGAIFSITTAGEFTLLHHFTDAEGATPVAPLIQGSDGNVYGTTLRGGASDFGTVFKLDPSGTLTTLHSFTGGEDGKYPEAGVVQATDGRFYGVTTGVPQFDSGGPGGTIFRVDAAGTFSALYHFADGRQPHVELTLASDGNLYGATRGAAFTGRAATIFKLDLAGTVTTVRTFLFGQDIQVPLRVANEGYLYGATVTATPNSSQIFFRLDATTGTFTDSPTFSNGLVWNGSLIQTSDGNFYGTFGTGCTTAPGVEIPCYVVFRANLSGSPPFTTHLHALDVGETSFPIDMILGADGSFYGTTAPSQGIHPEGTVFKYDLATPRTQTVLHRFGGDSPGGANPASGVIQGMDGRLYGTALNGGAFESGTVFTIDSAARVQALLSFENPQSFPLGALLETPDGLLWGMTHRQLFDVDPGGSAGVLIGLGITLPTVPLQETRGALIDGDDAYLYGTILSDGSNPFGAVFRRSLFRGDVLHRFSGSFGSNPSAGVVKGPDGAFYGTTSTGGPGGQGTVFKVGPVSESCDESGTCDSTPFATLHLFSGPDGAKPLAPMGLASDGRFYGTTSAGGPSDAGILFAIDAFGNLTTVHAFSGPDGRQPLAGVLQARDGNVYGTTCQGGGGFGTVFRIDATGQFTPLHSFSDMDGRCPSGELIQASDGHLYGTTRLGGQQGAGVLFRVRLATTTPDGYFEIVSRNSGKCLDISGASTDAAAAAIQWTCHGGPNQQWRLEPAGGGAFRIIARHSGQALDVYGASLDDVAPIIQWPVHGGDNQAWTLEPASDGYVRLVVRHSGKAMDVEFASTDEGARVIQYTPHDGANQQWLLRSR